MRFLIITALVSTLVLSSPINQHSSSSNHGSSRQPSKNDHNNHHEKRQGTYIIPDNWPTKSDDPAKTKSAPTSTSYIDYSTITPEPSSCKEALDDLIANNGTIGHFHDIPPRRGKVHGFQLNDRIESIKEHYIDDADEDDFDETFHSEIVSEILNDFDKHNFSLPCPPSSGEYTAPSPGFWDFDIDGEYSSSITTDSASQKHEKRTVSSNDAPAQLTANLKEGFEKQHKSASWTGSWKTKPAATKTVDEIHPTPSPNQKEPADGDDRNNEGKSDGGDKEDDNESGKGGQDVGPGGGNGSRGPGGDDGKED